MVFIKHQFENLINHGQLPGQIQEERLVQQMCHSLAKLNMTVLSVFDDNILLKEYLTITQAGKNLSI